MYWISFYDTYKNGYNSTLGGNNFSSKKFSKEVELKRQETRNNKKSLKSENHPRAKLKNDEILVIRQRYIDGDDIEFIYQDFKHLYSIDTFKRIVLGYTYKDVGNIPTKNQIRYTNKNKTLGKLSKDSILGIRNDYQTGDYTYKQLSIKYQTSISNIGKIINYQLYKNI